jgi:nitroimidazol reductase NimA-like FMN-containing flavoprotein (pyridoxamine 5'-phosphate oxidase superfamily)
MRWLWTTAKIRTPDERAMTAGPEGGGYPISDRNTPTRKPERVRYEAQPIHSVLDEALICHVGYIDDGAPVVIPTIHVRVGENVYLHTSSDSRLARLAADGTPLCITVTLLDGLVLARSQFNHSINYRSAIVRGEGVLVTDDEEKRAALAAVVEHVVAGRSRHSRPPSAEESAATALVRVTMTDVALKSRSGPPADSAEDLALHHWAGVLGIRNGYGPALPAPDLPYDRPVPTALTNYSRSARPQGYR